MSRSQPEGLAVESEPVSFNLGANLSDEWVRWSGATADELLTECPRDVAYLILERYWNDGSPSGFGLDLPAAWSPTSPFASFELAWLAVAADRVMRLGDHQVGGPEAREGELWFPVHPSMAVVVASDDTRVSEIVHEGDVVPMASGRTVAQVRGTHVTRQLKLHYPGVLGRFSRDLHLFKVVASLDRSRRMDIALGGCPEPVAALMRERGGAVLELEGGQRAIGYISRLHPSTAERLIPLFSLWATAPRGHRSVLAALAALLDRPMAELVDEIVTAIVGAYFALALDHGLMPELNAQNVVLEIGGDRIKVWLRDMQDVFVDLVQAPWQSDSMLSDYKLVHDGSNDTLQRRSFSYDFKLGHYIIEPLLLALDPVDATGLEASIRRLAARMLSDHPDYMPLGAWYRYRRSAVVGRSEYEEVTGDPRFR